MKANYPEYRRRARESPTGMPRQLPVKRTFDVSEEERLAAYEAAWESGRYGALLLAYTDLLTDKAANDSAVEFLRSKIGEIVENPEVAETLAPSDHPFGTKRSCLDTNYYATYNRDNVTLVDVRKSPVVAVTPAGIRTSDTEYELDAIVFATGFDAMTGALSRIDIRGAQGRTLKEKWASGPRSYLGLAIAGFPNLFLVTGPGSPSVLSNMIVSIEQHVDWITDCIASLRERGLASIEATEEAEEAWVDHVNAAAAATLYPMANSWYLGANIPGKRRVFMPYVGGVGVYRERCDKIAAADYEGFRLLSTASSWSLIGMLGGSFLVALAGSSPARRRLPRRSRPRPRRRRMEHHHQPEHGLDLRQPPARGLVRERLRLLGGGSHEHEFPERQLRTAARVLERRLVVHRQGPRTAGRPSVRVARRDMPDRLGLLGCRRRLGRTEQSRIRG